VECWGNAGRGGTAPGGTYLQVDGGHYSICGLDTSLHIDCWGDLGSPPPALLFDKVSAGGYHACGLETDGAVRCWGDNTQGQCIVP